MWSWISVVTVMVSAGLFSPCMRGQDAGGSPYVVFWNLENFFDPFDDSLTVDEEFTPAGDKHWTWKKFLVKRNLIAKAGTGPWPWASRRWRTGWCCGS